MFERVFVSGGGYPFDFVHSELNVSFKTGLHLSFFAEKRCRSIPAKPVDKRCRREKHSQTLKRIDEL